MWMAVMVVTLWTGHDGPLSQVTSMMKSFASVTRSASDAAVMLLTPWHLLPQPLFISQVAALVLPSRLGTAST